MIETEATRILRSAILRKRRENPLYTNSALARDVGVTPAFLSSVLNGKKKLSLRRAGQLSHLLKMSEEESDSFLRQVAIENAPQNQRESLAEYLAKQKTTPFETFFKLEDDQFQAIADWYHFAILDLTTCRVFESSPRWIAKRLKISILEAKEAIDRLLRLGLLKKDPQGNFTKAQRFIYQDSTRSTAALREHHRQMLQKAIEVLKQTDQTSFERRNISGFTLSVNPKKLAKAKKLIAQFQNELVDLLTDGPCEEVYELQVNLFPLSEMRKENQK